MSCPNNNKLSKLLALSENIKTLNELQNSIHLIHDYKSTNQEIDGFTYIKIAVLGNCTLKPLADFLYPGLLKYKISPDVWEAPYNQWASMMMDVKSELYKYKPAFVVIYLSSLGITCSATTESYKEIEYLENCCSVINSNLSTKIIIILPEPLEEEMHNSSRFCYWRKNFIRQLQEKLSKNVIYIDVDSISARVGFDNWFASRYWYHAKYPCHPQAYLDIGKELSLTIAHTITLPIKIIACDLDNTLWGGTVGEDGWYNLKLDVHSSGGPYIRLQSLLKELKCKGIILAIVSKNNENDAREAFNKRTEMLLKWEDFNVAIVNWQTKSENIKNLASSLNIGLQNICFLDDSEYERNEVRIMLPEVIVPELPKEPEGFITYLMKTGLFHITHITDEDMKRADMYATENKRKELLAKVESFEDYLFNLKIELHAMNIDQTNMDRVVQLIHKVNQFNLTTQKPDINIVHQLAANEDIYSYCFKSSDIYGDSGITGVLIATPCVDNKKDCYEIFIYLMSCRVMGRTIEKAMFKHLVGWLSDRKIKRLIGHYIPSDKNKPVEGLLQELGFDFIEHDKNDAVIYEYNIGNEYYGNKFVEILDYTLL